jgi:hypothetical protein
MYKESVMSYKTNKDYVSLKKKRNSLKDQIHFVSVRMEIIRIKHLIKNRTCTTPYKEVCEHFKNLGYETKPTYRGYTVLRKKEYPGY